MATGDATAWRDWTPVGESYGCGRRGYFGSVIVCADGQRHEDDPRRTWSPCGHPPSLLRKLDALPCGPHRDVQLVALGLSPALLACPTRAEQPAEESEDA